MRYTSSIGYEKYPTDRDVQPKNATSWLKGKIKDDELEAENGHAVWRIHNKLYDLTEFIPKHPGGAEWIKMQENADITEAFEAHHPNITAVEKILEKYYLRDINTPRNSPFTFKEDGFYCTLRRRVLPILQTQGIKGSTWRMRMLQDGLVIMWVTAAIIAMKTYSYYAAIMAGILLAMAAICAHNFFHQADNWRMYIFDLSFFSSHQWRISHALSHHLYPNTIYDFEISMLEPIFCFLPQQKGFVQKYLALIYANFLYCIVIPIELVKRTQSIILKKSKFRPEYSLGFIVAILLMYVGGFTMTSFYLWLTMSLATSFWFSFIGLIAAHHHPEIWHEGDEPTYKDKDWGLFQIDAVRDRYIVSRNLLLVSTMFGDHTLHHLFPTVDHSKLASLYPVFLETCKEFGVNFEEKSILSMAIGKYRQMMRDTPNSKGKKQQ